jgi:putative glutamine amidotransferase
MSQPVVGILPDFCLGSKEKGYSAYNYYALRQNYVDAINNNGALAIILTYNNQAIKQYLNLIDGLLIVGGNMDIHPNRYQETEIHPQTKLNLTRENFEFHLVGEAIKNLNLPIFGICNGMQLLSVLHQGKIIQHISDHSQFINHEQSSLPNFSNYQPYHQITINPQSKLAKIVQDTSFSVNSSHHQAIIKTDLNVCATAQDGIIEAVEDSNRDFYLGVQWHPEFLTAKHDNKIFQSFVSACKNYHKNK